MVVLPSCPAEAATAPGTCGGGADLGFPGTARSVHPAGPALAEAEGLGNVPPQGPAAGWGNGEGMSRGEHKGAEVRKAVKCHPLPLLARVSSGDPAWSTPFGSGKTSIPESVGSECVGQKLRCTGGLWPLDDNSFLLMAKTLPRTRLFTPVLRFIAKFFCLFLNFELIRYETEVETDGSL